ncbi:MAG: MerR family DNA-binding transcriptional regulator [Candidatus Portnoybacteria bacterium CG10_big_fil_rev_8_21_14_0_10_44_7]|uniref:MerR family DNA-binding transcriptional regulator n=1 Tax=Candidatus Portnoybacteria bacterium CG10_big_fil_rev_8_21_14_0_10_44_7 TaxID=1974816 RepID=A0A2M8KIB1_9BACT|nr:MAG: MerR family DNA-binding transcriptional regulator [Candidatus Portnoybacteria bacterium CG10_big_fil_rev_8_21_14_0_10_44_7]
MKYITIKKAARLLHVAPLTLRNWDKKGFLRAYRNPVNNYRLYRLDQLEEFLRRIERSRARKSSKKIDVF